MRADIERTERDARWRHCTTERCWTRNDIWTHGTMTVKNRNKNNSNSNDKTVPSQQQDDTAKKSPKVAKAENAAVSSRGSGSGALIKFLSALFYLALAAGAVFASLYLHQELSDIKHANSRHEESMKKCTTAAREVEHALQQVSWLHSCLCRGKTST